MPTATECKALLTKIGFKVGISPRLISLKLLSPGDKKDMLAGLYSQDEIEAHVRTWLANGMHDYVSQAIGKDG